MTWFWSTPEWQAYRDAYGQPHESHTCADGNLILRLDAEMWGRIRKGHRAAIRAAEREVLATRSFVIEPFHRIHALDAGRETRPKETWRLMADWLRQDHGRLYVAGGYGNKGTVAGAYMITKADGAYYASAAKDPELPSNLGVAHLLVWTAMFDLAAAGYKWLDMGPADGYGHVFKKAFGAAVISPWTYEL